jgi:molybdate transport system substrate-binding protein
MADPALAPAGTYAEEALRQVGIYDELKSRLVPTLDVRSAADAVASGAAEFGIIYRTDATAFGGLSVVYEIPGTLHEPISYFAAPISSSDNASDAEAFMEFLGTPWVGDVFESNGFTFIPAR